MMRLACAAALCCGCTQMFGLAEPRRLDASTVVDELDVDAPIDAFVIDAPPPCVKDDFEDGTIHARWQRSGNAHQVVEANGTLDVALNDTGYDGIYLSGVDARNTSFEVDVAAVITAANTTTFISAAATFVDYVTITTNGTSLAFAIATNNMSQTMSVTYDPDLHRHWRVQFTSNGVSLYTSTNGVAWQLQHQATLTYSIATMNVGIGAATTVATSSGTARFEHFLARTATCAP